MRIGWFPWKFFLRRAARNYGVIDPLNLMARLRRFSQPSEVQEPIELLRAGIIFHARGLINTKAIQYNLDWIWPYWVEKQFDPADIAFTPRGFAFSHVNLTHRNWTAVGRPDLPLYPIVDPRGLITPLYDGWSVDCWVMADAGDHLVPSRQVSARQWLDIQSDLTVVTQCHHETSGLKTSVRLIMVDKTPHLSIEAEAYIQDGGWLAIAVRPYNPEGIQFIDDITVDSTLHRMTVNESTCLVFSDRPDDIMLSNYREGDVFNKPLKPQPKSPSPHDTTVHCPIGMASGMSLFRLSSNSRRSVQTRIDLSAELDQENPVTLSFENSWGKALDGSAKLQVPDSRLQSLYDIAMRSILLLSAEDVVPGPYTYKRFWFRDACCMLQALLAVGQIERAGRILEDFPIRQRKDGYFHSQEGEWDSNGQVLWIINRYHALTRTKPSLEWRRAILRAVNWIEKKRIRYADRALHNGLLPAGFSAEHLGPNDYYYWDNFWSIAGLEAAADIMQRSSADDPAARIRQLAEHYRLSVFRSIKSIPAGRALNGIPASPYRRMDAGAIGSMVADYPLQLTDANDARIRATADFLIDQCFHDGAFFQDMIHSGINAYLTLAIAQTLLRNSDERYRQLVRKVAELASPTGQWPEAIHPATGGGCMGDGQHGWAAAEWLMMIRNLFVREEGKTLIFGSGIFPEWLQNNTIIQFGPTPTPFGPVSLTADNSDASLTVRFNARFGDGAPPEGWLQIPGHKTMPITDYSRSYKPEVIHS